MMEEPMGLFDGLKKKGSGISENETKARELLEAHETKALNDTAFLKAFGKIEVLYSTPFGDTKDGQHKLFLIPGPAPTGYMPLFLNESEMKEYYERIGRGPYTILKGPFAEVLEVGLARNKEGKLPVKIGYLIDPLKYKVTVDAPILEAVIRLLKEGK